MARTSDPVSPLPPGSTVGILGNGQLGRMMALAAAPLGYRVHIYDPRPGPATAVSASHLFAAWDDDHALDAFASSVDVVTLEFENVPVATLHHLERQVPVRPGGRVLAICQDRIAEKTFLRDHHIPTAAWRPAQDPDTLGAALRLVGGPSVIKTARAGYDGKGQLRTTPTSDPASAWQQLGSPEDVIVEDLVAFTAEISVIVARGIDGSLATYEPTENRHEHHVLRTSRVPANLSAHTRAEAIRLTEAIAVAIDLIGILAVELFVLPNGRLLVNELAPRPHNSGHWTLDAATCSQFEQAIRAVCGLPLGPTTRHHDAEMHNLLGDEALSAQRVLADPTARLHLYGKTQPRPGRKMGHVTWLKER